MKFTVKKISETEEEMYLPSPCYYKYDGKFFKIISETNMIEVRPKSGNYYSFAYAVINTGSLVESDIKKIITEGNIATEEDFISALLSVQQHVNGIVAEHTTVNQDL